TGIMAAEIVDRRRRVRDPLQCGGIPGILACDGAVLQAPEKIEKKDQLSSSGDKRRVGHEHMERLKNGSVGSAGGISVASNPARDSHKMHGHEDAIGSYKGEPEVKLSQWFAHHATKHFREPEIGGGKNSKDGSHTHHQMKVRDNVVSGVKHIVHGRLRQEQAGESAAHKQRNETKRKKHGRLELNFAAPQRSNPVESLDRGRNANRHSQHGKCEA